MATLQPALLKIIVLNYKTNNALITDPDIWRLRRSSDKRSLSYACAQTLIRQEPVGIFLFFLFFFYKTNEDRFCWFYESPDSPGEPGPNFPRVGKNKVFSYHQLI